MKIDHAFLKHIEGKILLLGLLFLGFYLIFLLFCAIFFQHYLQEILSITATNVIFGRMAGLSVGVSAQMNTTFLVLFNLFIESTMVLILYPLFVLSWKKLDFVSYPPLSRYLERSKINAHRYEPLIKRYGVIGLILFVLTPFAMTGPVAGSFVGFLIGLRHRVTLSVVIISTFIAILLWIYLIKNFEETLVAYSDMLMIGVLIIVTVLFLWYLMKKVFRGKKL
ncbi:MAG TPA: small multi-drug export protein [Sulfurovum sp.]|uniref:small multi-drug export protein n=1 Tax=Sulfurovum sp. TaxID=1969726 RepID=UPI002F95998F